MEKRNLNPNSVDLEFPIKPNNYIKNTHLGSLYWQKFSVQTEVSLKSTDPFDQARNEGMGAVNFENRIILL